MNRWHIYVVLMLSGFSCLSDDNDQDFTYNPVGERDPQFFAELVFQDRSEINDLARRLLDWHDRQDGESNENYEQEEGILPFFVN